MAREVLAKVVIVILSKAKGLDSSVASLPQNDRLVNISKEIKWIGLPLFSLVSAAMARKIPFGKIIWVVLVLCLLGGAGGFAVRAEEGFGVQLVVMLDSADPTGDGQMNSLLPQAASLLVHLLSDQDYLGLVGPGATDGILLPTAGLSPKHRLQALDTLARFAPAPDRNRVREVLQQALGAFQPHGPKRRVLFWLGGGGEGFAEGEYVDPPPQIDQLAAQARRAGVTIFAGLMAPAAAGQTLTEATGGRFWKIKTALDLQVPCLKLYQHLAQPQEAPINGAQVLLDRWVNQAVMVLTRADPEKKVVLTDPGRAQISARTRAKNLRWVTGRSWDLITLSRPRPGVWSFTGAQPEACKVFLSTELTLSAANPPREVGEDEALLVTAALHHVNGTPADPGLLAGTKFSAELQLQGTLLTAALKEPSPAQGAPESAPEFRTGRFPPLHQEGEGTLSLKAVGKSFQRRREFSLTITKPWYRVIPPAEEGQVRLPLRFQPNPGRRPERVEGTLTLKSALGSLSGIFINPVPGAEIILDRFPGSDDFSLANLHLNGTAPDGRPLAVAFGPLRLHPSQNIPDHPTPPQVETESPRKVQVKHPLSWTQRFRRSWVWLGLCVVGGGVLLVSAVLLWRLRAAGGDSEGEDDLGGSSPANILRLKTQVETMVKEKGELEAALKEKNQQAKQLQAEKAELQADLERLQKKVQANLKALEEAEKKLAENEEEAQRVKQEYMALYARNQREQEALKKN